MAEDDIEKLLNEISQSTTAPSPASSAAQKQGKSVQRNESGSGRLPFAIAIAVVLGGIGFIAGLIFPFVGGFSAGIGAAMGSFLTALITGPPRWFSR